MMLISFHEYIKVNWAPFVMGLVVVGWKLVIFMHIKLDGILVQLNLCKLQYWLLF